MPKPPPTSPAPRAADVDLPLVRAARSGSFEAFEQLVAKYERPIFTLAMRIVQKEHDAEEVVQETFLSAVEHIKGFREASSFKTWLIRIATNHALKILRKRRNHPAVPLETSADGDPASAPLPHPEFIAPWSHDPQVIAQQREAQRLLADALAHLDEKYRMVFLLRDVEGLSTEEAAEALGITVANAKVRLLRARLMLRERLTRLFGDEGARVVNTHDHDGE
jgi:RNA polymerase sigma-70 factor, ECF subfamily